MPLYQVEFQDQCFLFGGSYKKINISYAGYHPPGFRVRITSQAEI